MSNRICIIFFKSIRNIQFYSKINRINFLSFNKILNRCRKILNNFGQPECIGISSAVFSKISRNDLSKNDKNNFCIWNQLDIWSQLELQMYIFNFADSCQKIMITRTKNQDMRMIDLQQTSVADTNTGSDPDLFCPIRI